MSWTRAIRKYRREIYGVMLAGPVLTFCIALLGGAIVRAVPVLPSVGGTSAQAAWIGFFGNFSGGIIGGVVALFILQRQKRDQMQQSQRALFTQLGYTVRVLEKAQYFNQIYTLVYDDNWSAQIAYCQFLTHNEFERIVNWFSKMKEMEIMAAPQREFGAAVGVIFEVEGLDEIKKIVDKHQLVD